MKIRIMSDLHLEFADMTIEGHEDDQHTILVLAGDIGLVHKPSNLKERFLPFLARCAAQFRYVVMVVGNHEHYGGSFHRTVSDLKKAIEEAGIPRVVVLEKETFVVDGVAFIGSTLWTNCEGFSPYAQFYWANMTDFRVIRTGPNTTLPYDRKFRAEDAWVAWQKSRDYLFKAMKDQNEIGNKIVVITHHAPSPQSIAPQYAGSNLNMFYYSDMVHDVMDHNPDIWIHGHVHNAFDYYIDSMEEICKTRVICNPRGYHGEETSPESRGFDIQKSIEL